MSTESGVARWLFNIHKYGIGFVSGIPATAKATENCAKRISHIRETHWGQLWQFKADWEHGDTAYTHLALPAHTDTTYFSDPIGLQFFHILKHEGGGGQSLYVDGYNIARELKKEAMWAYLALSRIRINAHCSGDTKTEFAPAETFPIIQTHPETGQIVRIRFNNDDRSPLQCSPQDTEEFYMALHEWMKVLRRQENEFWVQLKPGTAVSDFINLGNG